jgi:nicotinamide riboside kinase
VLFGPECSGKSTLASALAAHYNGVLSSEFLRNYAQHIWDTQKRTVARQDISHLMEGQFEAQQQALEQASSRGCPAFMDTNIEQLDVYFTYYFGANWGQIPPNMRPLKDQVIYLLTKPDIPWEADDLRDQPLARETLFSIFKTYLDQKKARYKVISGSHKDRLNQACEFINKNWPNLHV